MGAVRTEPGARKTVDSRRVGGIGRSLQSVLASMIYFATACVVTWPMPAHPTSQLYGLGGDLFGAVGGMREIIDAGRTPFLPGTTPSLGAPDGAPITYATNVASWVGVGERWLSSLVFGPILGWNIIVLAGFVATGVATFLLVRRLTGSPLAAFVSGWAFAFWPFAVRNGAAHVEYAQGWVLIVLAWRLLRLREEPSRRQAVLAGLAMLLCFSYTGYFVIMGAVVVAAFYAVDLVAAVRPRRFARCLRLQSLSTVPPLVALMTYALIARGASGEGLRIHPLAELYTYSARPEFYVNPVPTSLLFGERATRWWSTRNLGVVIDENGVYVGITVLALAVVGVAVALLVRSAASQRRTVLTLVLLAALAFAFSGPPTYEALGLSAKMPSWFVFQITSTWRVYARFGMVVMLAVVLLAGYGLAAIERRARARSLVLGVVVSAVVVLAVGLDLWSRSPSPRTTEIPGNAVYDVLDARNDGGIVAEYPLVPATVPGLDYVATQDRVGHPLLNGYSSESSLEARALWLAPLDDPRTAGRLALLGIKYVTLPDRPPAPGDPTPPSGRPVGNGLVPIEERYDIDAFEVRAAPAFGQAWTAAGFAMPEGDLRFRFAWLTSADGVGALDVDAYCPRCGGVLRFTSFSFGEPRRLTIKAPSGRVVYSGRIGTEPQKVRVPLPGLDDGDAERYTVTVDPKPKSPRQATGALDDRPLGVAIQEPDVQPAP